jgi:hypothetical protein
MQDKADIALGGVLAVIGTTGAAVQWFGDVGSLFLIGLNVIVAGGGIYLGYLRIKIAKMDKATAEARNARLDREANERASERETILDQAADERSHEREARLDREAEGRANPPDAV